MTHFFEKRDPWGHGMALWVLVAMIFIAPLAWWSVKQIDLENDVENWLPSDDSHARIFGWFHDHFPAKDRILVSWKGSSLEDPRVQQLKEKLEGTLGSDGMRRNGLKSVESVVTPHDVIGRMVRHKIEHDEAIRRLQGVLIGTGPLKVRLTEAGRDRRQKVIQTLQDQAKLQLGLDLDMSDAAGHLEELDEFYEEHELDGEQLDVSIAEEESVAEEEISVAATREHDVQVAWMGMHVHPQQVKQVRALLSNLRGRDTKQHPQGEPLVAESFFEPGSPVALSVSLSEAGKADRSGTFQAIRRAAEDVGIPENNLYLGGRAVVGSALNQAVKKAAWNREVPITSLHKRSVLLTSVLVAIGLAVVMLRSVRLVALVLVVAVYTTLLAVALVPITNGSMNMVLVVMPTLLIVLSMSAAIHMVNYWRYAFHQNVRSAVVEAVKMARQPCTLASVTTAIGLMSLATSPLAPVRDFGFYSAVGCLLSLVVVLFGLPALLEFWPAKSAAKTEIDERAWTHLAGLLTKYRMPVIALSVVAFGVCTYGLRWFHTETKVIRYFPDHARVVQDYRFLEENLSGIIPVETIVCFDRQAQQETNFLQRLELVRDVQDKIRAHPEISGTISLTDFQPVSVPPAENATFLQKARYHKRANAVQARITYSGHSAAGAFLAIAKKSADLQADGSRLSSEPGDELWRITAQVAILSDLDYGVLTRDLNEIARSTLKYHTGAGHVVTGMVPLLLRTQQAVLESLIHSFCLAFAVIAVMMVILLKSPASGLISMLPNLLPVGLVFGLICWNDMAIDIGTMITASVALGIAVDGTLHMLTWFRAGIADGLSRRAAVERALLHCGPAMCQTSAAIGIGLLMLSAADLLLVSRFGWLMAALIGTALISDLILLPALLAGPLGHFLEKTAADRQTVLPAEFPSHALPHPNLQAHIAAEKPRLAVRIDRSQVD